MSSSVPSGAKPPNYLVGSILATLFCCLPFGIVSIVFAAQVDSRYNAGDIGGAEEASDKAKTWLTASVVCGLVAIVIWLLVFSSFAD